MAANINIIQGGQACQAPDTSLWDPRAAIDPSAEFGHGCTIGPFAVIGPDVRLGAGCMVHSHAVIQGPAILGADNVIHSFACIGGPPQDLRYQGERTHLIIGNGNEFREYVTINRGTPHGGGITRIGDNNLIMAYSHIAHDCTIGNRVVMANHGTLAGHTTVDDHVVFGGMVAIGTFLHIGESAMLAAGSMIERDVPPFCTAAGDRARLRAVNRVGLTRRGFHLEAKTEIHAIFKALRQKGRPLEDIVAEFDRLDDASPEATRMIAFLRRPGRCIVR